ncbi:hypothetical protein RIF29_42419 [Crotalaria pallida]|uniref:Uncharacterized protein n=1 Tax=Crotalaria pallida TaxID=3830 RepID=A0AAN9E7J1_CROPI
MYTTIFQYVLFASNFEPPSSINHQTSNTTSTTLRTSLLLQLHSLRTSLLRTSLTFLQLRTLLQLIQLARALYQDADIDLLDDPFSAVDAHSGSDLCREYILAALADKTVIFVTHQVEFLPSADMILEVQEGSSASDKKAIKEKKKAKWSGKKQLVQEEERVRGRVSMKVYLSYMASAYKGLLITLVIIARSLFQFLQIASSWWMAWHIKG